ncbi:MULTISPECIES: threonine ammonia-lyase [Aneurinibacillus]|jgi:threonine dehydratase|uniref:L-threonine dehydratase catabolic TdcB n=1 Tax=Aneurinibacillus thermoaerophilus TaxID=143495 RepID=A0A1G7ZMS7_ANETH|nr:MULTISPECIES: threonine ammonia-lyase [Aneurinibacillus]AMA72461.1 threonine dehydratase [Aneurinibacillus sp. XH2]MED0675659.1 threonine ammonia-lyase [Aneurinibacillus thermoaerophilus]MED0679937.1 threonine ammonia-lyase [Aneurinibacillus thermoaerophilus]MED0735560.1 threonine ammonia-lyase [Aneurinibacillus thermoaerophilus]MED0757259.1 threonine ammonia-lyase [Aneurinibacillus thermoaerophilus]
MGRDFFIIIGGGFLGNYEVQLAQVQKAGERLKGVIHKTPLHLSQTFSRMCGCEVYLKLENLQKTGAFKIRGAYNKLVSLSLEERKRGLITASAGNHAQGVALAAQKYGIPATVVMPAHAPKTKIQATEGYGARVVLHGATYDDACAKARQIAAEEGSTFVHAFDDPDVIAGQGTIALEIFEANPDLDVIVVPIGGGGLISGIAAAAKALKPSVKIIGVQPAEANSGYLSWKAGKQVLISHPVSIADGLSVKMPGKLPLAMMCKFVDDIILVTEEDIKQTMRLLLERSKVLAEGAGAAALSALISGKLSLPKQKVAFVVSGGNVDLTRLSMLASQALVG